MIDHNVLQAAAARRKKAYGVLSAYFMNPPSPELAAIVSDKDFADVAPSAAAREFAAAAGAAAAGHPTASDVTAEHTSLFVLPSGVVPHESCYLDEQKRLGGHITVAVQQFYEEACASFSETCLELPDHFGVELEFMTFLCDLEEQFWAASDVAGLATCLGLQRSFLDEHLLRWHRPLCEKILARSEMDLYRTLARLAVEFLDAERERVLGLIETVQAEGRVSCACAC